METKNNILSGTRIFTATSARGVPILLLCLAVLLIYGYSRWEPRPNLVERYSTPPNFERVATLKLLNRDHYEFCYKRCERGIFQLWRAPTDGKWKIFFHGALIEEYDRLLFEDQEGHAVMMRTHGPPDGRYDTDVETYWGKSRLLLDGVRDIYLEPVE